MTTLLLAVATQEQLKTWKNSETLWLHDLEAVGDNPLALTDLGVELDAQGRGEEADRRLCQSLALSSNSVLTHINRGNHLRDYNRLGEAEDEFRMARKLQPDFPLTLALLSEVLLRRGKLDEAEKVNQELLDTWVLIRARPVAPRV